MNKIHYNDIEFEIERAGNGWEISRRLPDGTTSVVGAGLFAEFSEVEAEARAQALVRTIFPAGIKLVGPDVAHPATVGEVRIVGPDVGHPNFIYWSKDSTSFAK